MRDDACVAFAETMQYILVTLFIILQPSSAELVDKVFKEVEYQTIVAKPEQVEILWLDNEGKQIRTFPKLSAVSEERKVVAVMNGGIFERGEVPTGLLIQNGKELSPLNLRKGKGNFYLKPNGVFYLTDEGAFICDSEAFSGARNVKFATQSGPLLLNKGVIHAAFNKDSTSRLLRNGVGVRSDGRVVLAISKKSSEKQPNLYEFSELFKRLGCVSALYLDGVISDVRNEKTRAKPSRRFSSFVLVYGS